MHTVALIFATGLGRVLIFRLQLGMIADLYRQVTARLIWLRVLLKAYGQAAAAVAIPGRDSS